MMKLSSRIADGDWSVEGFFAVLLSHIFVSRLDLTNMLSFAQVLTSLCIAQVSDLIERRVK
jgi:hypothetical protein